MSCQPLDAIDQAEGFPDVDPAAFSAMFRRHMGGDTDQIVTRIEFRHLPAPRQKPQKTLFV